MSDAAPFGTVFGDTMCTSTWTGDGWSPPRMSPVQPIELHPASHALHYGSSCFEGLKVFRGAEGDGRIFRLNHHVSRMRASAARLCLPVPDENLLMRMVVDTVRANLDVLPDPPGALYVRPTLIGTTPNIGAAAAPTTEALLFVLTSPVGDYFAGDLKPLRIAVETARPRTTPQFGSVKTGANYAMALGITMQAQAAYRADQVLFAPGGVVEETGASNIILLDETRVLTPACDGTFLEGVTRASLLCLATELGFDVEETRLTLDDLLAWASHGEIALSGTAAVLAPVGTLIVEGAETPVSNGKAGPATLRLRKTLIECQTGQRDTPEGWITHVR